MFDRVLGPKHAKILNEYGKVLNITEFHSKYASISHCSEYARICLDRILNTSRVLNMPGFEYGGVLNMQELQMVLNMPQLTENVWVGHEYVWNYDNRYGPEYVSYSI